MLVVALPRRDGIGPLLPDRAGDLLLVAQGVEGDDRPGDLPPLQQLGDRRDFVGFLVPGDLARQQVTGRGPGVDQVPRRLPLGPVEGAAPGRAVAGADLPAGRLLQRLDLAEEAPLGLVGVEPLGGCLACIWQMIMLFGGDRLSHVRATSSPRPAPRGPDAPATRGTGAGVHLARKAGLKVGQAPGRGRLRGVVRRIGVARAADSCHRGISRASFEPRSWARLELRPAADAI